MLRPDEFRGLLLELMAGPADSLTVQHVVALLRGGSGRHAVATAMEEKRVRRSDWAGWNYPECFLGELHEALISEQNSECDSLAAALVQRMRETGRPWIRGLTPRRRDSVQIHQRGCSVTCIASYCDPADPDEPWVLSGGDDGTVELWNPRTLETRREKLHENYVQCLAVLPDGRVVSGSSDKTVRLWDPRTGTAETIITHDSLVECLAVLPDGRVVSGSSDNTVRLWDPRTGTAESIITHDSWVECLAVLPDGRVVSGSFDKTVQLWDPASRNISAIFWTSSGVRCLAVSADSSRIYAGLANGEVPTLQFEPQDG